MPLYVTPESLILVRLIQLYCDGAVGDKATIRILSYLTSQIAPKAISNRLGDEEPPTSLDVEGLKKLCGEGEGCNPSPWSRSDHHVTLLDLLRVHIRGVLRNFDYLVEMFKELKHIFEPDNMNIALSWTSLLGTFVRRQILEFEKLQFSDQMKLWHGLEMYYNKFFSLGGPISLDEPYTSLIDLNKLSDGRLMEIIERDIEGVDFETNQKSSDVTKRWFEFQVERMQSFGARLPIELRRNLQTHTEVSNDSPSLAHYARFLDAWYAGDYPSSFESLHRYYDYALQNKDRSNYQYALLNMAILHADFGCYSESMAAIAEAIAAARESKDMPCLTFCLSWLYHFRILNGGEHAERFEQAMIGEEMSTIRYLAMEAGKHELWGIACSAKLSEAALCLAKGHPPREAFEGFYETAHLSSSHNIHGMDGAQLLAQSSLFGRLGNTSIAKAYSDLVVQCYNADTPAQDVLTAQCQSAYLLCLAGKYTEAFSLLAALEKRASNSLKTRQYLTHFSRILKLQQSIYSADLTTAESLLTDLAPFHTTLPPSVSLQIHLLHIKYLSLLKSFPAALTLAEKLISSLSKHSTSSTTTDIHSFILLLNAKAALFIQAGRPQKAFTLAMRAAMTAWRGRCLDVLWESVGLLGQVFCALRSYEAARDLVESVHWQARETENLELCATLATTLADAYVGLASESDSAQQQDQDEVNSVDNPDLSNNLRSALKWVEAAYTDYKGIGHVRGMRDMEGKKRLLVDALGLEQGYEMKV